MKIRQAKSLPKAYKLFDADGLFLIVTPNGGRWWRLKYRIAGKEKLLALGVYPEVSLKQAREKKLEARQLLARGIDPGANKKAIKASARADLENAFEVIGREWFTSHVQRLKPSYSSKVISLFERKVFPLLGKKPITEICPGDILQAAKHLSDNGRLDTAHRLVQLCGQLFRYAMATNRPVQDITVGLHPALPKAQGKHMATILDKKRIGALLRSIDAYKGHFPMCCALKLAPLFFVRPGNLASAEWNHIDFDDALWRIPPEAMKMGQAHLVPLAKQAMEILRELRKYTGHGKYLFPSYKSLNIHIAVDSIRVAFRNMGFGKQEFTTHGFRSMASTLLNEMGYRHDIIERQLAHGDTNTIRATYNFADWLPERRKMMQQWANFLDKLRSENEF